MERKGRKGEWVSNVNHGLHTIYTPGCLLCLSKPAWSDCSLPHLKEPPQLPPYSYRNLFQSFQYTPSFGVVERLQKQLPLYSSQYPDPLHCDFATSPVKRWSLFPHSWTWFSLLWPINEVLCATSKPRPPEMYLYTPPLTPLLEYAWTRWTCSRTRRHMESRLV